MDLEAEKRRINTLLGSSRFVSDLDTMLAEIKFNHEDALRDYFAECTEKGLPVLDETVAEIMDTPNRTLSEILTDFWQKHAPDYDSYETFISILKETMRVNLKSKIASAVTLGSASKSQKTPSADIENQRQILLGHLQNQKHNRNQDYIDYMLIYNEIETCSPQKLEEFIEFLKSKKKQMIQHHSSEIERAEQKLASGNFSWKREKFETEQYLEQEKRLLNYYLTVDDLEASIPLIYQSNLSEGNELTSVFVDKHIDTQSLLDDTKKLQFVCNIDESIKRGLVENDMFFDGERIVCKTTGETQFREEVSIADFLSSLENFSRRVQTNFAYNPSFVKKLLKDPKYPIDSFTKAGSTPNTVEKFCVYADNQFAQTNMSVTPLYLKHVTENTAENTISVSFYVFEKPDMAFGTQIYRIDKVKPIAPYGSASSHKQSSGEVIVTNVHVHNYDLLDRVLVNTRKPKELGHGDISTNFITDAQIENNLLEILFNQKCGISKEMELVREIETEPTTTLV